MARLTALERRILGCAGTPAADVAHALGLHVDLVRAARARLGRDGDDGLACPSRPSAEREEGDRFFDSLMKANRGVC